MKKNLSAFLMGLFGLILGAALSDPCSGFIIAFMVEKKSKKQFLDYMEDWFFK